MNDRGVAISDVARTGVARGDDASSRAAADGHLESALAACLPPYRAALGRLIEAVGSEADLTEPGAAAFARAALAAAHAQREPAHVAAGSDHAPVVFITGLHRTGTTLLQHLLAAHPDLYAPSLWELMNPGAGTDEAQRGALIARTKAYVEEYYRAAPAFRIIHPLDAQRPEECHRLIGMTFLSEIYALRYRVPGYLEWLDAQDHRPAYGFHRQAVHAIRARAGVPAATLVLKCPFHVGHGPELAAVYPRARVVRMHRDPVRTIASISSLTLVVRQARARGVSAAAVGDEWLGRTRGAVAALTAQAAGHGGLPTLDLGYRELVGDPLAAAVRVCRFLGVRMTAAAEASMRAFLERQPADEHGGHSYRPEDFGLNTAALTREFADYRDLFRV